VRHRVSPFFVQHGEDSSLHLDLEMKSHRIVSLVSAATEIATALGLMQEVVGVSHECDYPAEANERPRVLPDPSGWRRFNVGSVRP